MAQVVGLVLYEPEAEASLAQWIMSDVFTQGLRESIHHSHFVPAVKPADEAVVGPSAQQDALLSAAHATIVGHMAAHKHDANAFVFFVVAVFWDGQSESAKASFAQLRQLSEERSTPRKALLQAVDALPSGAAVAVEVLVQALSAKKGEHKMQENRAALVQSLQKKLSTSHLIAAKGVAPLANGSPSSSPATAGAASGAGSAPAAGKGSDGAPTLKITADADITAAALDAAVEGGQGECFFLLSAGSRDSLAARLEELRRNAESVGVSLSPVMAEPREVRPSAPQHQQQQQQQQHSVTATSSSPAPPPGTLFSQEWLLRRSRANQHLELRLAMCGNVDSGKSTLTSVLTRGGRDDGRGAARAFVFNHKHEAATGRTSSVSENHLGFTGTGEVVNYQLTSMRGAGSAAAGAAGPSAAEKGAGQHEPKPGRAGAAPRPFAPQELVSRSAKVFTLYDLAGHERYLKTTVLGMTRNMPDYACIVISANNGIQRMTKEHLALCLALKLPFFITVTRIDATPENVHRETMGNIHKLLKIPTVRKLPYPVTKPGELVLAAKNLYKNAITPIFEISNVTGQGIPELLQFLNLLPLRKDWRAARAMPQEMVIDSTFFVTGVGTVVGGIVTQGVFRVNDTVLLGPDGFGHYRPVAIKSIHVKGVDSVSVEAGNDAAFCLKKEKRSAIRKGNILADPAHPPQAYWQFEAEITILYHSTTITIDYEPVIHSTTVRQSARMTYVEQETLRTGDKSIVRFHFLYRPEFMKEAQRLIFREGRTKGIGIVTKLIPGADEQLLSKNKVRKAEGKRGTAGFIATAPDTKHK